MPNLYRVEVEQRRTSTFYVQAETEPAARADANELADGWTEWDYIDTETYVTAHHKSPQVPKDQWLPSQASVWTGGPDGIWLTWEAINAG